MVVVARAEIGSEAVEAELADACLVRPGLVGALGGEYRAPKREPLVLWAARDAKSVHLSDELDLGAAEGVGDLSDRRTFRQVAMTHECFEVGEPEFACSALPLFAEAGCSRGGNAAALLLGAATALERSSTLGVGRAPKLVECAGSRQREAEAQCFAQARVGLDPSL